MTARTTTALATLGWPDDLTTIEIEVLLTLMAEHIGAIVIGDPLPFALARVLRRPLTPATTFAIRGALESLARRGLVDRVAPARRSPGVAGRDIPSPARRGSGARHTIAAPLPLLTAASQPGGSPEG